jgi:hypothetical protein
MSSTLRIALVGEGVTDYVVLRAAIESMLGGRSYELKMLQPEGSVAFTGGGDAGPLGGGWRGVYKWCLQSAERGDGHSSGDPLFIGYDLLVLHVDADVANENPAKHPRYPIPELAGLLPCAQACPKPSATTNLLRRVILTWMGEAQTPSRTVLCTPSKSTEAWVMATFFPNDAEMMKKNWECHPNPEERLRQQPHAHRIPKSRTDYERRSSVMAERWPSITTWVTEAERFQKEFTSVVESLSAQMRAR